MLKVINREKIELLSYKDNIIKEDGFFCPVCNELVIFVDATLKIKHFRHKSKSNCVNQGETLTHIEMKMFMKEKINWGDACIEVNLNGRVADLYNKELNVAVEVQHSHLTVKSFIERTKWYSDRGIYVIWVFDPILLKNVEKNKHLVANVSSFLRKAHEYYFGRVYFYQNGVVNPIHFSSHGREVTTYEPYDKYGGEEYVSYDDRFSSYYKYYKKKKRLIVGQPITNFGFLKMVNTFRDNNVKIARFYDKKFWGGV